MMKRKQIRVMNYFRIPEQDTAGKPSVLRLTLSEALLILAVILITVLLILWVPRNRASDSVEDAYIQPRTVAQTSAFEL